MGRGLTLAGWPGERSDYRPPTHEHIARYLDTYAELERVTGHKTLATWVREHGKAYWRKPHPEDIPYGRAKECYGNATLIVVDEKWVDTERYVYCEGYASRASGFVVPHAWVIDTTDGKVIDSTWRDGGWECPFCFGTGIYDDDGEGDEEPEEVTCFACHGSGRTEHEQSRAADDEYFGVTLDRDWVIKTVLEQGHYGVLERYVTEKETT